MSLEYFTFIFLNGTLDHIPVENTATERVSNSSAYPSCSTERMNNMLTCSFIQHTAGPQTRISDSVPVLTHCFPVLTHGKPRRHVETHTYFYCCRTENEHFSFSKIPKPMWCILSSLTAPTSYITGYVLKQLCRKIINNNSVWWQMLFH